MSDIEKENNKFSKITKDPLPLLGMGGFFTVVALSIYNYRKKGTSIAPSVYVIQTRMAAQGLVIALLSGAAGYQLFKNIRSYGLHNPHEDHHHHHNDHQHTHNNQHNHDHATHK